MGWLSGWKKRIKLEISNTNVDAVLTNFPVLVYLSASSGTGSKDVSAVFDELASDGNRKKIAVTSSDGETELYVEIERWDDGNEKAWLWVKVPSVASGSVTELYLYFDSSHADNTSYVGDIGDTPAKSVWDSNFKGVWHMTQDPDGDGANTIKDSTSNINHGTPVGTMLTEDLVDGKIGKAIQFDGNDDAIDIGTGYNVTNFTLEAVVSNEADPTDITAIFSNYYGGVDYQHYGFRKRDAENLQFFYDDGVEWDSLLGTIDISSGWFHLIGVLSAESFAKIYVNGTLDGTDSTSIPASITPTGKLYIAKDGENPSVSNWKGKICDIRISDIARSAAWIKATYYSSWDNLIAFAGMEVKLVATGGTYALTGADVTLTYFQGYVLGADGGSYVLTGSAIEFKRDYILGAGGGAYVLSGTVAALLKGYLLGAGGGSYALSGADVSLDHLAILILLTSMIAQEIEFDSEIETSLDFASLIAQEINLDSYLIK